MISKKDMVMMSNIAVDMLLACAVGYFIAGVWGVGFGIIAVLILHLFFK